MKSCLHSPEIADYHLIKPIGEGACGEVWLARTILGGLRAIKIIQRRQFKNDTPYQSEFEGILHLERISRSHAGLVQVHHVGRSPQDDYFYYVMELADDLHKGHPQVTDYVPKSLRRWISHCPPTPGESLDLCIQLAGALGELHREGLIHRDIKPSNVILVGGVPKFADLGLVTWAGNQWPFVGTPGYVPPEGPSNPASDIYSFGKLMYELFMRRSSHEFPALPTPLDEFRKDPILTQMNEVILRACHPNPSSRYTNAEVLQKELLRVRAATIHHSPLRSHSTARASSPSTTTAASTSRTTGTDLDKPLVCFIDDDLQEVAVFSRVFQSDLNVVASSRYREARARIQEMHRVPDLFLLDLYFPTGREATDEERKTMLQLRSEVEAAQLRLTNYLNSIGQSREGGLRLLQQVRRDYPDVPISFYTRKGTPEDVAVCMEAGAREVLRKPQPEAYDPNSSPYEQLETATRNHRIALLHRLENLVKRRPWWKRAAQKWGYGLKRMTSPWFKRQSRPRTASLGKGPAESSPPQ